MTSLLILAALLIGAIIGGVGGYLIGRPTKTRPPTPVETVVSLAQAGWDAQRNMQQAALRSKP